MRTGDKNANVFRHWNVKIWENTIKSFHSRQRSACTTQFLIKAQLELWTLRCFPLSSRSLPVRSFCACKCACWTICAPITREIITSSDFPGLCCPGFCFEFHVARALSWLKQSIFTIERTYEIVVRVQRASRHEFFLLVSGN